jgi:hypothetical protein
MDEQKQFQDEYEQRLADALDQVEQGYVTADRMAIIRHACNLPNHSPAKLLPVIYNFNEIFEEIK